MFAAVASLESNGASFCDEQFSNSDFPSRPCSRIWDIDSCAVIQFQWVILNLDPRLLDCKEKIWRHSNTWLAFSFSLKEWLPAPWNRFQYWKKLEFLFLEMVSLTWVKEIFECIRKSRILFRTTFIYRNVVETKMNGHKEAIYYFGVLISLKFCLRIRKHTEKI